MNQFLYLTLFIAFINFCYCATYIDFNALHKDYPGKCYDKESKHIFNPGEIYKPIGRCLVISCTAPGQVQGHSCGKVIMPDECVEIESDLTKPHPYCCDQFLCKVGNGKEIIINPSVPEPEEYINNQSTSKNLNSKVVDERVDNHL